MPKIHASAIVEEGAAIGEGTRIWHHSHIREGAKIGSGCNIGKNVYIDRNVVIGDNVKIQNNVSVYDGVTIESEVFIGPSVVFTNDLYPRAARWSKKDITKTQVKKGASVGANSTIICGNTIGEYAMIGAGSTVTSNIPAYALAYGNPAEIKGRVCRCGRKLTDSGCTECREGGR